MGAQFYGDVAIAGGDTKALVSFKSNNGQGDSVTTVIFKSENESGEIAAWGPNNDFPQKLLKEVRLNGAALSGLRVSRKAHYGGGFVLAKEEYDGDKRTITPTTVKQYDKINKFWKLNQMKRFFKETINDLEYFAIAFPEYILSKDFNTINRVKRQKTAHCRFELMDKESRSVKHVYISSKWDDNAKVGTEYVDKVQLIDSYWSAEEVKEYCKKKKIHKFIRPIFYPLLDESYYPKAEWHTVFNNDWLAIANSIPKVKKSEIQDRLNINYHIEVFEEYFQREYIDDWEDFDADKKQEIRREFIDTLTEKLSGAEKGGQSIMSMIYKDDDGKPQPGLKITTIDKKKNDGIHLQDTSAGNQEILTAIGVDPSLIGAGIPGGKLGAGSGSDKREAWLILSALMKTNRETTLEPFEFIQEYNGWDDKLIGGFENTVLTTLDKNPTGSQNAAQL